MTTKRQLVTKADLVRDLRTLGVDESVPVVEAHVSMSSIGWVVGGAQALMEALQEALGAEGSVVALTGWQDRPPYHQQDWDAEERQTYEKSCPPFDPSLARSERALGRFAECVRTWPGAEHSSHPVCGFTAVGSQAAELMVDQPDEGYGLGSPLAKMHAQGGSVLLLGVSLETVTFLHYAEYVASVDLKRYVEFEMPVLRNGERVWKQFRELDSSLGAFPAADTKNYEADPFELIVRRALEVGVGSSGRVGNADANRIPMRPLLDVAIDWFENEFQLCS